MNQLPTYLWNEIAQEQDLKTEAARLTFAMSEDQMTKMVDEWENLLVSAGLENKVATSVSMTFPILAEQEAIQRYLRADPARSGLRQVLVELNSPQEAVDLMQRDRWLNPLATRQLSQVMTNGVAMKTWLDAAFRIIGEPPKNRALPASEAAKVPGMLNRRDESKLDGDQLLALTLRRAIAALQSIESTDADYELEEQSGLMDFWEEICVDRQVGESDIRDVMEHNMREQARKAVEQLKGPELAEIWPYTSAALDWSGEEGELPDSAQSDVVDYVFERLCEQAAIFTTDTLRDHCRRHYAVTD